jgi:dTDP-4-amino-4,6-dideoxygalactose transaminase
LEDAAQGFGAEAEYKVRKACSFGDIATTSFFPAKPLRCHGDGGAIFTNDDEMDLLLESLRVHSKGEDKYDLC